MQNLLKDFVTFIKSLSFIDIVFIVAILGLIVLVASLIYIYKMDYAEEVVEDDLNDVDDKNIKDDDELDLVKISKEIDESRTMPITLNDYEKEQEEKAIISYDELIKTKEIPLEEINYVSEENVDGLTIKSVDTLSPTKPIELPKIKEKYDELIEEEKQENKKNILISYEKEEEFLKALKTLDELLN